MTESKTTLALKEAIAYFHNQPRTEETMRLTRLLREAYSEQPEECAKPDVIKPAWWIETLQLLKRPAESVAA